MIKFLNKWYSVFIAALGILFFFYHKVLLNLNGYIFSPKGDGIKNYYTYMYHARYGTNFWEFKGMNFPFYEHIVYTDAHPLLSYLIGKLGLVNYGVGILNGLMLLSFPIAAVFIFLLLKHYKVRPLWSFLGALSICFMAPQVFRLTGHLSLSYVFAIPLMCYLVLNASNKQGFLWPFLIFITLFVFFFTHPYLGLILAVFGLFYALVFGLFNKKAWKTLSLRIVLPVILPVGLFQMIVALTDTHSDRMKTPTGFFEMYAKWNSLLVPHHGPVNKVKHWLNWQMSSWESWTYLGFFIITIMVFAIIYYFKNRKEINLYQIINTPVGKLYIVGHLVLLFSFCFPLKYSFLRWVVEVLGPLQQFRVLGRFAWVYFYVASILSIVVLHRIMQKSTRKTFYQVFFLLGIAFSILEFYPVHKVVAKAISTKENPFIFENLKDHEKDIVEWTNQQSYDAILFLPFTHLSSENIFLLGTEKANYHSFLLSYHTGLPLLNTSTSRTSVSEAVAFYNLFSPEFVEKTFHQLLPDSANVMLIKNREVLNENELRMTYSSEGLYENDEFNVYNLSFDQWNNPYYFKQVEKWYGQSKTPLKSNWFADTSNVDFIYDSFDNLPEKNSMTLPGALAGQKNGYHFIKKNIVLSKGDYICSFWYNYRIDRADQLAVVEQKFLDGTGKWVSENDIRQSNHIIGDWALVEMPFTVGDSVESTTILLSGNKSKKWFIVDDLLIRKKGDHPLFRDEIKGGQPYIIYNNYWLKKNSFSESHQ